MRGFTVHHVTLHEIATVYLDAQSCFTLFQLARLTWNTFFRPFVLSALGASRTAPRKSMLLSGLPSGKSGF